MCIGRSSCDADIRLGRFQLSSLCTYFCWNMSTEGNRRYVAIAIGESLSLLDTRKGRLTIFRSCPDYKARESIINKQFTLAQRARTSATPRNTPEHTVQALQLCLGHFMAYVAPASIPDWSPTTTATFLPAACWQYVRHRTLSTHDMRVACSSRYSAPNRWHSPI